MGHGTIPDDLNAVMLCKEMKWTYTQYAVQPRWFIESLSGLLRIDTQEENKRIKKSKNSHG